VSESGVEVSVFYLSIALFCCQKIVPVPDLFADQRGTEGDRLKLKIHERGAFSLEIFISYAMKEK